MQKRLKLLPSLKERKRYVVYEALSKKKVNDEEVLTSLKDSIRSYLGELNTAKAGLKYLKDNIIRVDHKHVDELKSAIALVNKKGLILKSKYVSGTLKKAREKGRE